MNLAYQKIINAPAPERKDLFIAAASEIGTTAQNIEKDFWVCWTLDVLFNRLPKGGPRLLFKGGTSLSKAFGIISRFSEDIDVTVFREDIGEPASWEELQAISKTKRVKRLKAIKEACQSYVNSTLLVEVGKIAEETMNVAGRNKGELSIVPDPQDQDGQSLLVQYESVLDPHAYVIPSVKIESGAKSALDPNAEQTIIPYLAKQLGGDELAVSHVTTIEPERTFLDKVIIAHGMTHYFEAKSELRGSGRMSRHYYDIHQLMSADIGKAACRDKALVADCVEHARTFFFRNHTGLEAAAVGSFRLTPTGPMLDPLRSDYNAMATMIFGAVPKFDAVLESVTLAEQWLNST